MTDANIQKKVCVIGFGKWGTAISRLVGANVLAHPDEFASEIRCFAHPEMHDGRALHEVVNEKHENPVYLPGRAIPVNVVAVPAVVEAVEGADVIIFVVRQQFLAEVCNAMKGSLKCGAIAISLTKSLYYSPDEGPSLHLKCASDVIRETLDLHVSVLMGANLATEVADEHFSETTIGCKDECEWNLWKNLFSSKNFKVYLCKDVHTVELCGALKNVVASAAGIVDGLGLGDNTKSAIFRIGFTEIIRFIQRFYGSVDMDVFWGPCGFSDLICTCYGGITRNVVDQVVKSGKPLQEVEKDLFNGMRLEGPINAMQVYSLLKENGLEKEFPLHSAVYRVFHEGQPAKHLIDSLSEHF